MLAINTSKQECWDFNFLVPAINAGYIFPIQGGGDTGRVNTDTAVQALNTPYRRPKIQVVPEAPASPPIREIA